MDVGLNDVVDIRRDKTEINGRSVDPENRLPLSLRLSWWNFFVTGQVSAEIDATVRPDRIHWRAKFERRRRRRVRRASDEDGRKGAERNLSTQHLNAPRVESFAASEDVLHLVDPVRLGRADAYSKSTRWRSMRPDDSRRSRIRVAFKISGTFRGGFISSGIYSVDSKPELSRLAKQLGTMAAIAALYFLAARMGLQLGTISGFATLVWPPTGIALVALLLGGYRLWPGVFLGALVVNIYTGAPTAVALGIATGNTLEALLGAYLLKQLPDFRFALDRVRDAVALIIAGGVATVVSATIGVTSLDLGGLVEPGKFAATWRAWWLGDAMGALLIAPAALVWSSKPIGIPAAPRLLEASALTLAVFLASIVIFVSPENKGSGLFNQAYVFFPLLTWAAIRYGQHGAVSTTLLVSVISVWGTATGHGPFADGSLHASLFALQTFMGVTAATFL